MNLLCLILTFLFVACTPLKSSQSTMVSSEIHVHTDRTILERQIELPKNVSHVKWIVLQQGIQNSNIPGPTDTVLYATLTRDDNDWSSLPEVKQLLNSQKIVRIPLQVANKLFSTEVLKDLHSENGYLQITGRRYEPSIFNKGSYQGVYAILVQDNLLVYLQSM